jgi:hypothetical protein
MARSNALLGVIAEHELKMGHLRRCFENLPIELDG